MRFKMGLGCKFATYYDKLRQTFVKWQCLISTQLNRFVSLLSKGTVFDYI
jgi:hypothetical protein